MKTHKTPIENQQTIDAFDYLQNAASVNDCTGLIPSLPTSEEELESYLDVYEYLPPDPPTQFISGSKPSPPCRTCRQHLSTDTIATDAKEK